MLEVSVNTDETLCRERRPQASFEGFEAPQTPDVTVALDAMRIGQAVKFILEQLDKRGQFTRPS